MPLGVPWVPQLPRVEKAPVERARRGAEGVEEDDVLVVVAREDVSVRGPELELVVRELLAVGVLEDKHGRADSCRKRLVPGRGEELASWYISSSSSSGLQRGIR